MAHFTIDYDVLQGLLSHATAVTSDSALKDSDKTIIFMVDGEDESKNHIVAKNTDLFIRVAFTPMSVTTSGSVQVNSAELSKILATYSGLSRTKVDSIEFRVNSISKVQVIVHESGIDEDYAEFGGDTSYSLDNIKIKEKVLEDISVTFDVEGATDIDSAELNLILSTLMPNMDSKKGVNNNQIHFAEDVVFVMDTRGQTFFKNILPEVMQNSSFRYTSVAYMRKMIETSSILKANLFGNKFALRSENGEIEAFINQLGVRFNYKPTLEGITKENGVILDRLFLKDIVRRLSVMGADPKFSIKEGGILVTTDDFSRIVPISNSKGNIFGVEFKIKTDLLKSMIVGEDSIMSGNLFLYVEKSKRGVGYQLTISDDTGAFLSNTMVS